MLYGFLQRHWHYSCVEFTLVASFVAEGKKTRFTMHLTFPSAAAFQVAAERYGVLDGTQTLDRLSAYLNGPA